MLQKRRHTKYTRAVDQALRHCGHATNAQLTAVVRADYPQVSDTTIHRVTQRFYDDGLITTAPATPDGAVRYDANSTAHDHFICQGCDGIKDVQIPLALRRELEQLVEGCCLDDRLIVVGTCKKCKEE